VLPISRWLQVLLLSLALLATAACGGGGGGSAEPPPGGGSPEEPPPEPPGDPVPVFAPPARPAEGVLLGRVQKGILVAAEVTAARWSEGAWIAVDSTVSDEAGHFQLVVGDGAGPVRITARRISGSALICDFTGSSCQALGTSFGGLFNLPVPLQLEAIVPGGHTGDYVVVSPLTDLAAGWVDQFPGDPTNQKAQIALRRVADIFALPTDFVWHYPIDITRAEQIEWASAATLQHAWLSAAIGQDMLNRLFAESLMPEDYFGGLAAAFAGEMGQANGVWLGHIRALLDQVTSTVSSKLSLSRSLDDISVLVATLDQYQEALTSLPWPMVPGADDAAPAQQLLDHLDHYLVDLGMAESGDWRQRIAALTSWLEGEAEEWNAARVILDALVHGVVAGYALESLTGLESCVDIGDQAANLIATGLTDTVPLTLVAGDRAPDYIRVCPADTGIDLVFGGAGRSFLDYDVDLRLRVQTLALDAGVRSISLSFVNDALVVDGITVTVVAAGSQLSLQHGDDEAARETLRGLMEILVGGEPDSARLLAIRDAESVIALQLEGEVASVVQPARRNRLLLDAEMELTAPQYLAGEAPLARIRLADVDMDHRDDSGASVFRLTLRQHGAGMALLTDPDIQLDRPVSIRGSWQLAAFELPVLDINVDGESAWLSRQMQRFLGVFDGLGGFVTDWAQVDFQGAAEWRVQDPARDYPHYQMVAADQLLIFADATTQNAVLDLNLVSGGGGYLGIGNSLLGTALFWYGAEDLAGVDVAALGRANRVYRWAEAFTRTPPLPPAPPPDGLQ
jgi:hypothetical protein